MKNKAVSLIFSFFSCFQHLVFYLNSNSRFELEFKRHFQLNSEWCTSMKIINHQSHALSQWAQRSDLLWFHSNSIPVNLKILSMFILSPYVWWNAVATALPLAMSLHLKLPVTDLWQQKKRKFGWKDEMRDVNMEERQRSGQLNDQSQSLINPCMSTLTVSHIFNKIPSKKTQHNSESNQLSTRSGDYGNLYRTIPQHSLTHFIHYIVNMLLRVCLPLSFCLTRGAVWIWQLL